MYTEYAEGRGRPVSGSSRQSTSVVTPTPPSPRPVVHVGAAYEYEYDDEDEEDDWPPSVSQRRLSAQHYRRDKSSVEDVEGLVEMDQQERVLRKAKSLERTRTWAEEVARQRRKQDRRSSARHLTPRSSAAVPYDEADTGLLGLGYGQRIGLKTTSSIIERHQRKYGSRLDVGHPSSSEGDSDVELALRSRPKKAVAASKSKRRTSESSTAPSDPRRSPRAAAPRETPSPAAASPQHRMSDTAARSSLRPQVLSIDEIIRKHSPAALDAEAAIVTKARLDLGLSPKPSTPLPTSPLTPLSPAPLRTPRPGDTSTLAPLHDLNSQRDSPSSFTRNGSQGRSKEDSETIGESEELVMQDLEIGQQLLDKLERGSLASSGNSGSKRMSFNLPRSPTPQRSSGAATPTGTPNKDELSHSLARYLRSPSLNRILTLPRPFPERPLRVSLAEVGDLTGKPVLVFLGLGCARHLIAMYDDLAKALGLRLICIDRWGYGKTDPMTEEHGSIMRWAWVVEQVMDRLEVDQFQLMAHSAGAAYAVAVVLRIPERVKGTLYFLAPWVSTEIDGGYKWLKWVPNTVIKSATAAEHRLQTYFLGKPPPLTYQPIGYTAPPLPGKTSSPRASPSPRVRSPDPVHSPILEDTKSPKSPFSRSLGRAASKRVARQSSALGLASTMPVCPPQRADSTPPICDARDKIDLESVLTESPGMSPGMSPRTHSDGVLPTRTSLHTQGPIHAAVDIGLPNGFDTMGTSLRLSLPPSSQSTLRSSTSSALQRHSSLSTPPTSRSPSLAHRPFSIHQASPSPAASIRESEEYTRPQLSGAMLLALEQASHAESEPGSTHDLLTVVLGRQPWGFSYTDLPPDRRVRVYWGKEDDRVSEKGVRWLERNVSAEVVVLPGEGHGLMSRGGVVFDVLKSMSRGEGE